MWRAGEPDFDGINHVTPLRSAEEKRRETTLDRHSHRVRAWNQWFHLARLCDKFARVTRRSRLFWKGSAGGDFVSVFNRRWFAPGFVPRAPK